MLAILVSGFFFGVMHAILPGLLAGHDLGQIVLEMLNEIGGGIVVGFFFIYLMEKSSVIITSILFVHRNERTGVWE